MENLENVEKALRSFLDKDEIISPLASILGYGSSEVEGGSTVDQVSYGEIENLLPTSSKEIIKETLTWAAHWRLVIPAWRSDFRSLCWGDRMIISTEPETKYEVPRVVQCLVKGAAQTGHWNPEEAVQEVFKAISHLDSTLALQIVRMMVERAQEDFRVEDEGEFPYYFIPVLKLQEIFDGVGLTERKDTDLWVDQLKATDITSPAVPPTWTPAAIGCHGFEINPTLFTKQAG